jgi:hypothetical protein
LSAPSRRELIVMDVPGQRIAELRREIEGIQELNTIYRNRKLHRHEDQVAHESQKGQTRRDHAATGRAPT